MLLVLSPEDKRILKVSLIDGDTFVHEHLSTGDTHTGWLTAIDEALEEVKKTLSDITGIVLIEKESSFTGSRLMHTIGNTLAYAKQIPIVGIVNPHATPHDLHTALVGAVKGVYVLPLYSGEPNIGPLSL
jgi:tRNA A37 threonylcarbamoyladenosine modification protein TsaB